MADTTLKVTEAVVGTNLAAVTFVNGNGDTVKATEVTIISETGTNVSPLTDAQLRASSVPISGTVAVSTLPALPAGTNTVGAVNQAGTWNIGNITGAVSLPTGAATAASQTTIIGHLDGVEGLLTTIDADTGGILTAVQLLDDTVATDGAATLTKGLQIAGTDGTNAQIISTNATGHVNIADGGNSITVDGTVAVSTLPALPAGTNNIGDVDVLSLPALPAGTNNIGDVDVLSLPALPTGSNTIGNVNQAGTWNITNISGTVSLPTGAATAANQTTQITALQLLDDAVGNSGTAIATGMYRVGGTDGVNNRTLSVNTSGHVNIADGGNSITVDGTVAVSTLPALPAGTNNIGDVDVLSLPALPAGTNNIGDVDVLSLPALPAGTNNIGDVDVLSVIPGTGATNLGKQTDSPAGATDTGVAILAIRDDVLTTLVPADGDYTRLRVNSVGRLWASATIDAALPAGTNNIGDVDVLSLPALPAGTNNIGDVDVLSLPALPAGTNTIGFVIEAPSTLGVNSTGAAAAAVTLTLPAPGAGLFQYVDSIEITLYNSAARTGGATPVTVTSTNLPGNPTWLFPSAGAIGTLDTYSLIAEAPVKASTANTAVTIVCPAVTGGIWNVKAFYRTGA